MRRDSFAQHRPENNRKDISVAGTSDRDAQYLYDCWYNTRCESHAHCAAMYALMLRATVLGSMGRAWRELAGTPLGQRLTREEWALVMGSLVQSLGERAPRSDAAERDIVLRLVRAWEVAARATPPVWASPVACMPRLSQISGELLFEPRFQSLSPRAQVLLLALGTEPPLGDGPGCWTLKELVEGANLHESAVSAVLGELRRGGWISVDHPDGEDAAQIWLRTQEDEESEDNGPF